MINLVSQIGDNKIQENNFKKRMRYHQGWWRAFVLGEDQGKHPKDANDNICNTIENGENTQKNLLSYQVSQVVNEVLNKRIGNGAGIIEKGRLYNNLLSSQPLSFNFFSPLYLDKQLALKFIKQYFQDITTVNNVYFEYSNDKNKFDNSAFDVAFEVESKNGRGIIGFEVKYTDTFSVKEYKKNSYQNIFENSKIWNSSYEELTSSKFNQLFRNQLIGESFEQSNIYDFSYLVLFCHHDDTEAIKIGNQYKTTLNSNYANKFSIITYQDFFESIMKIDLSWEIREYFMLLWSRYCGIKLSENAFLQL